MHRCISGLAVRINTANDLSQPSFLRALAPKETLIYAQSDFLLFPVYKWEEFFHESPKLVISCFVIPGHFAQLHILSKYHFIINLFICHFFPSPTLASKWVLQELESGLILFLSPTSLVTDGWIMSPGEVKGLAQSSRPEMWTAFLTPSLVLISHVLPEMFSNDLDAAKELRRIFLLCSYRLAHLWNSTNNSVGVGAATATTTT